MVERWLRIIVAFALGVVVVSPVVVEAQQREKILRVGYISNSSEESAVDSAFIQGLRDLGRVDGRTIILEPRYVGARSEQLSAIARELVSRGMDVIAVWSPRGVAAAMEATSTVPIVGLSMGDLAGAGVVPSLGRPAANVTGVADLQKELQAKRLELLKETVPGIRRVAVLSNPSQGLSILEYLHATNAAARSMGVELEVFNASAPEQLEAAFTEMSRRRADGLLSLARHDVLGRPRRYREVSGKGSSARDLLGTGLCRSRWSNVVRGKLARHRAPGCGIG